MKTIAFYLPQFHRIPENDAWWGDGFTEWVNVKNAKALFEGHTQPKVPYNNNYYDLSDINNMRWQIELAKKYGLYGFCFYHYWFDGKLLLEKPVEAFLKNSDMDFPFCLCWANESWTNGWAKADSTVLMKQRYGTEADWVRHFEYLLPFFKDSRYIKEGNKPLLLIYRPYLFKGMCEMLDCWKRLAVENGFDGLVVASQRFEKLKGNEHIYDYMDYHIDYQPDTAVLGMRAKPSLTKRVANMINKVALKFFNVDLALKDRADGKPRTHDYEETWKRIVEAIPEDEKRVAGAFTNWDNTPRYKGRGSVFTGVTIEKFKYYLTKQIAHVKEKYSTDYLFMFAWNEWAEGGYMEPDEEFGYGFLEGLKQALIDNGEYAEDQLS